MNSKTLVIVTLIILGLIIFLGLQFNQHKPLPAPIALQIEGQPTIGYPKAKIHVVVFEEPKCSDCRNYTNTVFPKLKKEYIDTNKIQYTIIPVSFIPGSMPAAVAWLCVYNQEKAFPDKDLFFTYVDYMYSKQPPESDDWATSEKLQAFAKEASPAIKVDVLNDCVTHEAYRIQIQKNTDYGSNIMDGILSTPSVYVNGIRLEDVSYPNLKNLIEIVSQQKIAVAETDKEGKKDE